MSERGFIIVGRRPLWAHIHFQEILRRADLTREDLEAAAKFAQINSRQRTKSS